MGPNWSYQHVWRHWISIPAYPAPIVDSTRRLLGSTPHYFVRAAWDVISHQLDRNDSYTRSSIVDIHPVNHSVSHPAIRFLLS